MKAVRKIHLSEADENIYHRRMQKIRNANVYSDCTDKDLMAINHPKYKKIYIKKELRMKNVNILSLSFGNSRTVHLGWQGVLDMIKENLNGTEDLVMLPETCLGNEISELRNEFLSGIANIAAENKIYILASVYRTVDDKSKANSAILYDRKGGIAFIYDKMYPYLGEFNDDIPIVVPGSRAVYADTDFGRVSAAICFDANFPDLWQDISDLDTDIVLFSSAYSAGIQLSAHAINHHYAIVTATQKPDFAVYDIDGKELTYKRCENFYRSDMVLASRVRVDVDKVICHFNYNREKVFKMLKDHPGKIEIEHEYDREEWLVIRSASPDVNVRAVCKEYGVERLRDYKRRSRKFIEEKRGFLPIRPERL